MPWRAALVPTPWRAALVPIQLPRAVPSPERVVSAACDVCGKARPATAAAAAKHDARGCDGSAGRRQRATNERLAPREAHIAHL
eukprot:59260-Chlamydomonas_euryale.AAC.1